MTVMGEAGDALTLLEQAQAQCMDLVLLDWELPGLPATQVINTLRRTCPGTRVVALSGRSGARRAALITGVDAFVSKGDSPTQVLSILRSLNSTTATQRS